MIRSLNSSSLPQVYSYTAALGIVKEAKPQDATWKALNPKRKSDTAKRVRQQGASVIFRYHQTDVVIWHSPDHIEIEYYDSPSTAVFINCLSPLRTRIWRDELYVDGVQPKNSSVHFYREHGKWSPDLGDVKPQYKFSVDRKRASEVRKIITPVIEFRQAYCALRPDLKPSSFGEHVVMKLLDSPPKDDSELVRLLPSLPSDKEIIRVAMTRSGAVKKVELPVGTLPTYSEWAAYAHII